MTDGKNYINKMTASLGADFGVRNNILPSWKSAGAIGPGGNRT